MSGWSDGFYQISFYAAQYVGGQHATPPSSESLEVLIDGVLEGTFDSLSTSYYSEETTQVFWLSAAPHTIEFEGSGSSGYDMVFIDDVQIVTPGQLEDAGFEWPSVGSQAMLADPTGTPWSFVGGGAGISDDGVISEKNPPAPQGGQVAYLQGDGSFISQEVTYWAAGSYTISFDAAQAAADSQLTPPVPQSNQNFEVLVDGVVVGIFDPSSTNYTVYTTLAFAVTTGSHTIEFLGLDGAGNNDTALIDEIQIVAVAPAQPLDAGFGTNPAATSGQLDYTPTNTAWTFIPSGSTAADGIVPNDSGLSISTPMAPEGTQAAFVQGAGGMSQGVAFWAAGSYTISFDAAQYNNTYTQSFEVLVDGVDVSTFTPASASYAVYTTAAFTVTAGVHTIEFVGSTSSLNDLAFIDDILINVFLPGQPANAGFESPTVGKNSIPDPDYDPTGYSWTFSPSSGIVGNAEPFATGDAPAPGGGQVAFLSSTGSITQTMVGWAAGSYTISFDAAQYSTAYTLQSFEVLVDGVDVGTFTPGSLAYAVFVTQVFTVTSGTHTIEFEGLGGSDQIALLDDIQVVSDDET